MEAISHAGTVLGVLAKDGVVIAAEKKVTGKLLDLSGSAAAGYGGSGEKVFLLNSCVYAIMLSTIRCWMFDTFACIKKRRRGRGRYHCGRQFAGEFCAIGGAETFVVVQ
jgi:hypothetical protein